MVSDAPRDDGRRALSPTVLALGFTSLLTDVGSEMIVPLLPAFLAGLGAAPAFIGLVEGLADATASFLKLGSGIVSDRAPRKKPLVVFGYGIAALVRPLLGLAFAPWHVLALRVTDRVGKGLRTAPRDVLLAAAAPTDQAGRVFGFHRAMDHAGAVVGPLVATALIALGFSIPTVFLLSAVPGLLSLASLAFVREPSAALAFDGAAPSLGDARRLPPALRRYLAVLGFFALGNASDAFLLLRAHDLGIRDARLPLLWAVLHVTKLTSSYFGGSLSDRVPRVRLIAAGFVVYALTYAGFAFAHAAWQVWLLFVLYGLYHGLTEPAEKALVKDLAPASLRGRAFGLYHFVLGALAVPAGLLTGMLWQRISPPFALGVAASVAAVSSLLVLRVQSASR